jgi:hypothetical protein
LSGCSLSGAAGIRPVKPGRSKALSGQRQTGRRRADGKLQPTELPDVAFALDIALEQVYSGKNKGDFPLTVPRLYDIF